MCCFTRYFKLYTDYINNPYIRIIIAGALVIAMRYIFGTTDYLGAGSDIIARSFVTSCAWYVFLLKMLFTAVTLGGGFKGGEIVPTLFVGATLGSFLAPIFGLPVGLCAACGMVSVFCGVTNCPLTSFILSIEMFGASTMKFTILCIALIICYPDITACITSILSINRIYKPPVPLTCTGQRTDGSLIGGLLFTHISSLLSETVLKQSHYIH